MRAYSDTFHTRDFEKKLMVLGWLCFEQNWNSSVKYRIALAEASRLSKWQSLQVSET